MRTASAADLLVNHPRIRRGSAKPAIVPVSPPGQHDLLYGDVRESSWIADKGADKPDE
jgi:hypothetical protein